MDLNPASGTQRCEQRGHLQPSQRGHVQAIESCKPLASLAAGPRLGYSRIKCQDTTPSQAADRIRASPTP